jgi:hypothetical protein
MNHADAPRWTSLEEHSPTLFLAAGTLLVGYAALNGLAAFTDAAVEPNLFQFGYLLGFLGLLGLYPRLADRRPWLARAGAGFAAIGVVAFAAFTALDLAALAGGPSEGQPPGPLVFMAVGGFVGGYLASGAAALGSDDRSRTVGLALLVPGLIVVLMLAHIAAGLDSPGTAFVISAGQAMAHLAIGQTLRTDAESADREEAETPADATAKG